MCMHMHATTEQKLKRPGAPKLETRKDCALVTVLALGAGSAACQFGLRPNEEYMSCLQPCNAFCHPPPSQHTVLIRIHPKLHDNEAENTMSLIWPSLAFDTAAAAAAATSACCSSVMPGDAMQE